jgi:hypothetical protein
MSDFWRSGMGHRFFEQTLPELVRQITRVADALEALIAIEAKRALGRKGGE